MAVGQCFYFSFIATGLRETYRYQQCRAQDAAGLGGPVFGAGKDDKKQDLGVTGTG